MVNKVRSLICRTGRKKSLAPVITKSAPKKFDKYVESFVGTGDIYFALNLDHNVKAYLNDIDPVISNFHKLVKTNPSGNPEQFRDYSLEQVRRLDKKTNPTAYQKIAQTIFRTCGSYGGKGMGKLYKNPDIIPKLKSIPKVAEYMKNTTITKGDWKKTFKYDSPTTFFYLDPPYEASKGLYKQPDIDYEDLANRMRKLKGKVMLSINKSPEIKKLFKGFRIKTVLLKWKGGATQIGKDNREEYIITNY